MREWNIVALGNPGSRYEGTRHNAGRMAVDAFRVLHGLPAWKDSSRNESMESSGEACGALVRLISPATFMNESGRAVARYVKTPQDLERLIVVHDELDLPLGRIKVSFDRSSGGHKGVESLFAHLKSQAFARVRIGIAPPSGDAIGDPSEFVIRPFLPDEREILTEGISSSVRALEAIITDGIEGAMAASNAPAAA